MFIHVVLPLGPAWQGSIEILFAMLDLVPARDSEHIIT